MNHVKVLPEDLISKIAAGEVIERPASVIKELIENSFDAESKTLEINIEGSGKKSITIKDDGCGIFSQDLETIFLRHATSKIKDYNDLFSIKSLGFRGEALYSIAAISDLTLTSRHRDSQDAWQIHLRGGNKKSIHPVNMSQGTKIEIKELFFNTPARRKFLKSDTTELHQIVNTITPYTILFPQIKFFLTHYKKMIIDLPTASSRLKRIAKVLNLDPNHILETETITLDDNTRLKLYLSDINIQRARKDMQFIFVNNRPVQNHLISYHINQAYRAILPPEIFPFFAIFIDIAFDNIDVNIHPTKREVKIKNDFQIINSLRSISEENLIRFSKPKQIFTPGGNFTNENPPLLDSVGETQGLERDNTSQKISQDTNKLFASFDFNSQSTVFQNYKTVSDKSLKQQLKEAKYIGQFNRKYLFFESSESLLVIDQHAAQERITYETLITQIEISTPQIQRLLTPILLNASAQELIVWENQKEELEKFGFSTTLFDENTIALHSHPILIKDPKIGLRNLLSLDGENRRFDLDSLARR
ncbi:MAG: DNA mismatch repair endonuclease MutL, partial [Candidatus Omnitrophica bacterium]|nr:DNA mismatch repair endonuclease MutL [Candidatus Omnitrophota bacterium]